MSETTYTRRINIYVDSGQAQAAQENLIANQDKLTQKIEAQKQKYKDAYDNYLAKPSAKAAEEVKKLGQAVDASKEALARNNEQLDRVNKKLSGELTPSLRDLTATYQRLKKEVGAMSEQDTGFAKKKAEYQAAEKALQQYGSSLTTVKQGLKEMLNTAKGVAIGVLVGGTLQGAAQVAINFFKDMYSGAVKLSDEFADIEKTTGLSAENVGKLNRELSQIDTRTGNSKLREYAVDAGKLGKEGVQNIKEFVRQADQIDVALGKDLGEGAVRDIGKISDIFHLSMLQIASGINEVGQSSAASEAWQKDFMFRTAGMAKTVGLLAGEVLGYGAALDINGAQVEASATALQNVLIDFTKDIEKFGKATGMANGELTKLAQEKGVNAAFIEFLKNLKASSASSDELLRKLEALGIDGARGAATFLTLANNIGLVEQQQKLANEAIAKGTSVTEEFEKRNHNLAASSERLKKAWASLTTSGSTQEFFTFAVDGLTKVIKVVDGLSHHFFNAWKWIRDTGAEAKNFYDKLSEDSKVLQGFNSTFDFLVINPFRTLYNAITGSVDGLDELNSALDKTSKRGPLTIGGEEIDTPKSAPGKAAPIISGKKEKTKAEIEEEKRKNDLLAKLRHELYIDLLSNNAQEIQAIRDKYAEKRLIAAGNATLIAEINFQEAVAIQAALDKIALGYGGLRGTAIFTIEEIQKSMQKVANAPMPTNASDSFVKAWKQAIAEVKREFDSIVQVIQGGLNFVTTIFAGIEQKENQELERDKEKNKIKADNLKKQLDAKQISQEQYDSAVKQMDQKAEARRKEIAREQFERNKQARIIQATIDTAAAVVNALATSGNIYSGIALSGFAASTGLAQIGIISAEEAPEYEKGGPIRGPRHRDGGVPIIAEGDEYIVRRGPAQKYRGLLDMINSSPSQMNVSRAIDNIKFERGGPVGNVGSAANSSTANAYCPDKRGTNNEAQVLLQQNAMMLEEMRKFNAKELSMSLTEFYKKEETFKFIRNKQL